LHFGLGAAPHTRLRLSLAWRDRCGIRHTASAELGAGEHDLLLQPDGAVTVAAS
jgi:enediyne biosynthesis protein E4